MKGDALDGKDVYLTISRTEFKEGQFALTNVQTRPNPPRLHLTLTDCTFTGNTAGDKTNSSFMYLPNCQSLVIKGCTFNAGEDGPEVRNQLEPLRHPGFHGGDPGLYLYGQL